MAFFRDEKQKAGFKGYVGGLATALALWGFSIEGWTGKIMVGVAVVAITVLLFGEAAMGGKDDA